MIVSEAIRAVQSFSRDDDGTFVTNADILGWLNEGLVDLATRLELFDREQTGTTAGASIAFPVSPQNIVRIISLELGTAYADDVEFVAADVFDAWSEAGSSPGHTLARVFNESIELYPAPATGTAYRLRHKRIPVLFDSGDDALPVPVELERKLGEYGIWKALMKLGRTDDATLWLQLYSDGLPGAALGRKRTSSGPFTVTRQLNVWDTDPHAAHI